MRRRQAKDRRGHHHSSKKMRKGEVEAAARAAAAAAASPAPAVPVLSEMAEARRWLFFDGAKTRCAQLTTWHSDCCQLHCPNGTKRLKPPKHGLSHLIGCVLFGVLCARSVNPRLGLRRLACPGLGAQAAQAGGEDAARADAQRSREDP